MGTIGPRSTLIEKVVRTLPSGRLLKSAPALILLVLFIGCQAVPTGTQFTGSAFRPISGTVHGGQQPIVGASIQLYSAGDGGDGSAATPLLTSAVTTDGSGSFDVTGLYECPTPGSQIYLVATGGSSGLPGAETNAQIALMVALGSCGNLSTTSVFDVNEVTTVAAVFALSPYMDSYSAVSSGAGDAQSMVDAFTMAAELANSGTGSTPGADIPAGQTVPSQKINTLANILSACINTPGGNAGDSTPCGQLFSLASSRTSVPIDTVGALLDIAQNPTSNVEAIFDLSPPVGPFQPSLSSVPSDWTISVTSPTPSPVLSPFPGTFSGSQSVTLSDSNSSAAIYYTTDGSLPNSSSIAYTGAFVLSSTTTVRAVAFAGGTSSLLAAGTYTLSPSTQIIGFVFLNMPGTVISGSVIAPSLQVALEDQNGNVISSFTGEVTLALATNPNGAILSGATTATAANGIATFSNLIVTQPDISLSLIASSPGVTSESSANFDATGHTVSLTWDAPGSSADPVAGYNVYRAPSGSSSYQLLNSSPDILTAYVDGTVQSGQAYDYIVESVDASGDESIPSNIFTLSIP